MLSFRQFAVNTFPVSTSARHPLRSPTPDNLSRNRTADGTGRRYRFRIADIYAH